ncbi:thiamine diphosphokinase [Bifidobacterium xylocopae]|uniref:Thiamine diphosphokinase n=1 Tax=Bifidobacterium xylocopae TaxID=2493119 RepID=A0A366KC14_9BIFI|nr:thiamine diphosphokinase [Bifidobacterium xylocopae]RBP98782.1 thiamine diphosphokinase [Bifidobacterium xylocopae]
MSDEHGGSTCLVFGAGCQYRNGQDTPRHSLVIAADGGADHARSLGLEPDLIVGDFDSISSPPPQGGSRIIRLPAEKDDTDMQAALKLGWEHGYRRFVIYGGLGGRIDHSIANVAAICLLAQHGGLGLLVGDGIGLTAICDGSLEFPAWAPDLASEHTISVFSASDRSLGVGEEGLKYGLQEAEMDMVMSHGSGVSNEFLADRPARISVREGTLLVSYPLSAPSPAWSTRLEATASLGPLDLSLSDHLNVA